MATAGLLLLGRDHRNAAYYDIYASRLSSDGAIPVELTSFSASVAGADVNLNWQTATEMNNYGFEVERKKLSEAKSVYQRIESEATWKTVDFIKGKGTSTEKNNYTFIDKNLESGKYKYRLKQIDNDGKYEYSKEIEVELDVPNEFSLEQNYPNPFNPSTQIEYSLPKDTRVVLEVFNILGEKVATLINERKSAGHYNVEFSGKGLTSGIYIYSIKTDESRALKKMLLLK